MEELLYRARPWAITLILHNWPIMIYSTLIVAAGIYGYVRPGRSSLLLLYGLLVLALAFEYQKHGQAVIVGTTDYLFARDPGLRRGVQLALLNILPVAANLLGLALLSASAVLFQRQRRSRKARRPDG